MIEWIETICGSALGTSIPMVPFRYRCNNTNTRCCQTQHDIVLQITYPRYSDALIGTISYKVMVGPTVALIDLISMP